MLEREHYRFFTAALKAMLVQQLSDPTRPESHLDAVVLGKDPVVAAAVKGRVPDIAAEWR